MNIKTESLKPIELGFIDKGTGKHKRMICLGNIGVGGERGDVFDPFGICPCESATQYKDAIKVIEYDNNKLIQ